LRLASCPATTWTKQKRLVIAELQGEAVAVGFAEVGLLETNGATSSEDLCCNSSLVFVGMRQMWTARVQLHCVLFVGSIALHDWAGLYESLLFLKFIMFSFNSLTCH
jgi:hypothetical protein